MDNQTRGREARMLLDHPVMSEAFKTIEAYYTDQMASTKPEEREERDKWHTCLFVLKDVKTTLTAFVESGKIEASNEAKREKMKHDGNSTSGRDKQ